MERTLVLLKPDAVQRGLLGEIIARFERKGLKIAAMKMVKPPESLWDEHYAHLSSLPFFGGIKEFMMKTPVVALCL
jgi:nucleoside-diphosphate kinase